MDKAQTLWYTQPAARWLEALPVGNGRLGAMMHGRVHKEVVQLNEESLWTRPLGPRENPLALARLGRGPPGAAGRGRAAGALPRRAGLVRGTQVAGGLPDPWPPDAAQFRPSRGVGQ